MNSQALANIIRIHAIETDKEIGFKMSADITKAIKKHLTTIKAMTAVIQ